MTFEEQAAVLAETQAVIDRVKADGGDILWTLRNGVVLRCKAISNTYIQAIYEANPDPEPPIVHVESRNRDEPNPDHPDYKRALARHSEHVGELLISVVLGMATTLVSCPEGVFPPESDAWVEYVNRVTKFGGAAPPVNGLEDPETRYVAWLNYYAFDNESDRLITSQLPQWLGGLNQEEVAAAAAAFRGQTVQRTDPRSPNPTVSANGNHDNRAGRRRRS